MHSYSAMNTSWFIGSACFCGLMWVTVLASAWSTNGMSLADYQPSPISTIISDSSGARLETMPNIDWKTDTQAMRENLITINPHEKRQVFEGMGGSFMRAGATILNAMPGDVQENIIQDLFHPTEGAQFTVGKVPIGATDFGVPYWYTYADVPQSEDLPLFSIRHDLEPKQGIVPYVKRAALMAQRENRDDALLGAEACKTSSSKNCSSSKLHQGSLRLQATMDYPPDWMLNTSTPLPGADLNATLLSSLANYYLKYAQAMADNGVPVEYISLFNEVTDSYTNASYDLIRDLLVDHVGPLFRETPGAPKLTWTAKFGRRKTADASPEFLDMEGVSEYTDILFYHGYDCNDGPAEGMGWQCTGLNTTCPYLLSAALEMQKFKQQYAPYSEYPHTGYDNLSADATERQVWMTEVCYASEFEDYSPTTTDCPDLPRLDFDDAMQWARMIFADFNVVEANAWLYWNMILDTTGGPWLDSEEHNDPDPNPQQPLIVADPSTGQYYLTGGYYAMAHFSKYIAPGGVMRRLLQQQDSLYPTIHWAAFISDIAHDSNCDTTSSTTSHNDEPEKAEKEVVVVLMNDDASAHEVILQLAGSDYWATVLLPPVSLCTLKFNLRDLCPLSAPVPQ